MRISGALEHRENVALDTLAISIRIDRNSAFTFTPGQYIRLIVPDLHGDSRGDYREFSVTSSPDTRGSASIVFRESESAYKKRLGGMPIGSTLHIEGPFGNFTLPQNSDDRVFAFAGGVGVAPFLSMIRSTTTHSSCTIRLLYINHDIARAAFVDEIHARAAGRRNLSLSEHYGTIDRAAVANHIQDMDAYSLFYIAGPPAMVVATRGHLLKLGAPEERIRIEEFTGEESI